MLASPLGASLPESFTIQTLHFASDHPRDLGALFRRELPGIADDQGDGGNSHFLCVDRACVGKDTANSRIQFCSEFFVF